jgi:hypothetical protein
VGEKVEWKEKESESERVSASGVCVMRKKEERRAMMGAKEVKRKSTERKRVLITLSPPPLFSHLDPLHTQYSIDRHSSTLTPI